MAFDPGDFAALLNPGGAAFPVAGPGSRPDANNPGTWSVQMSKDKYLAPRKGADYFQNRNEFGKKTPAKYTSIAQGQAALRKLSG